MRCNRIKTVSIWVTCFVALMAFGETAWAETLKITKPVDIREGKGTFYKPVYQAKPGENLKILGREGDWIKVETPKGPGFVFAQSLGSDKPAPPPDRGGVAPKVSVKSSETDLTAGVKMEAPPQRLGPIGTQTEIFQGVATGFREPGLIQFQKEVPGPKFLVRLFGVEPPGKDQPFYGQAMEFSKKSLRGKRASVQVRGQTSEGFLSADVILPDKRNLGAELVRAGLARAGGAQAPEIQKMQALEQEARAAGRGIWSKKAPAPLGTKPGTRPGAKPETLNKK